MVPLNGGRHVDMSVGSVHFVSAENEPVEVHVAEALIFPMAPHAARATVTLLSPGILQIAAQRGDLNFSYRQELQVLPEGQT